MRAPDLISSFKYGCVLLVLLFLGVCKPYEVWAQATDSTLQMQQLGHKDIIPYEVERGHIIYAANRIAENSEELYYRTYVITSEEILANGYTSLTDVLRTLPDFRTSEPASALLGEAFLMRGLLGNIYTKILVNGAPVMPSAVSGMPLGSQLPIKQAQQIEIIMGPATTVYGNDAMAGVINIVLPDVERPVEAMANAAVGTGGTDEFHLLLGGKVGRAKNILKYQLYGSSKQMEDRHLNLPYELIQVDPKVVQNNPNYVPDQDDTHIPRIANLPHNSRMLGFSAQFQGLRFDLNRFYRKDHASLGAHPQEIAYHDQNTYVAERINQFQLQFRRDFGDFYMLSNASYLRYDMDNNSNYIGVAHVISNGRNFMYSDSKDVQVEQIVSYSKHNLSIMGGGKYNLRSGTVFQNFLALPFNDDNIIDTLENLWLRTAVDTFSSIAPIIPYRKYLFHDVGVFTQGSIKSKRLNLTLGVRADRPGDLNLILSPKAGIFFKVTDSIRVRARASRAFRNPGPFYTKSNFILSKAPFETHPTFKQVTALLQPEYLTSFEVGGTWLPGRSFRVDVHYFYYQLNNSIFPTFDFVDDIGQGDQTINLYMGYFNNNARSILQGFQSFVSYKRKWLRMDLYGNYHLGEEAIPGVDTIKAFRFVPKTMFQLNTHINIERYFRLSVFSKYVGDFTGVITRVNNEVRAHQEEGYYNIDLVLGRRFSDQIDVYFRIKNATNTINKGIQPALISRYSLDYIPQEARMFFIGLTFQLYR